MTEIVTLPRRAVRRRFAWLLPALFVLGSLLATQWAGNAGQLFCVGALAGVWAFFLIGSDGDVATWLLPTLLGGVPILCLLGLLLDRLQTDLRLWTIALLICALLAGYALLQGYTDVQAAVDHHGSFLAFCICAFQLGSYGATLIMLAVGAGRTSRR
jgi:hypothetical protein